MTAKTTAASCSATHDEAFERWFDEKHPDDGFQNAERAYMREEYRYVWADAVEHTLKSVGLCPQCTRPADKMLADACGEHPCPVRSNPSERGEIKCPQGLIGCKPRAQEECRSPYCECEEGRCRQGKKDMRSDEARRVFGGGNTDKPQRAIVSHRCIGGDEVTVYADSIAIEVGGSVHVRTVKEWHALAVASLRAAKAQREDYAAGYSAQVAKARKEGWYRDTIPVEQGRPNQPCPVHDNWPCELEDCRYGCKHALPSSTGMIYACHCGHRCGVADGRTDNV